MKVLKFGGTSLGDCRRIKSVAELVRSNDDCIVVCSAMSGVTDSLLDVAREWQEGNLKTALDNLGVIESKFEKHCYELYKDRSFAEGVIKEVHKYFVPFYDSLKNSHILDNKNSLLAVGEQVTSFMLNRYLQNSGTGSVLLNAFDFMHLDQEYEPVLHDIAKRLHDLDEFDLKGIYITQGFISLDVNGQPCTLKRGGSDYTATLIGAALGLEAIEIWTDIDGLHNNDPRLVENTLPVRELSFAEAAELAYFGAKILHPSCVWPARIKNIPIYLKNTLDPSAPGTCIKANLSPHGIKAVAAKDNVTIIRITSGRMVNAYGFLKRVFEVFDSFKVPVDTVTTSEVSVSITIDDDMHLNSLIKELKKLGRVDVELDQCIMCVVGDVLQPGHVADILQKVKPFKIKMVSLGASSNNITLVMPLDQKVEALKALHPIFIDCQISNNNRCLKN